MSIASMITRLQAAKTAISGAITNKGGTVTSGDGFEEFAADIATIPTGGETYVTDLTASSSGLDVSTLGNGIYHGKKKTPTTQQYTVIELYCLKQGNIVVFFVQNKGGSFRRNVNDSNLIFPNSSTFFFDASEFAIYKVADMPWEVTA